MSSWITELASGLVLALATHPIKNLPARIAVATAASVVYESRLDCNGWSWKDVGQRQVGIVLFSITIR